MIDTDKYKGHTEAPWELSPDDWEWAEHLFMQGNTTNFGNAMLITNAPLLLEEVKRLREAIAKRDALVNSMNTATVAFIDKYYALDDYMLYTGEEE
ncbi:MAG: hypothetical protein CMF74_12645 [Maricaulis sp.]|nr:hypothetical protein [Maricaulis sp.]